MTPGGFKELQTSAQFSIQLDFFSIFDKELKIKSFENFIWVLQHFAKGKRFSKISVK